MPTETLLNSTEIKEKELLYIPPKINSDDLYDNNKLFSEEQIKQIKDSLAAGKIADLNNGQGARITKKELQSLGIPAHFSLFVQKNNNNDYRLFAIYKGVKHNKHLGAGTFGTVKLVQDLDEGKFYAVKNQSTQLKNSKTEQDAEKEKLQAVNQLIANIQYEPLSDVKKVKYGKQSNAFIMELIHGQEAHKLMMTDEKIQQGKLFGEKQFATVDRMLLALDASKSLVYLHQDVHMAHNDIKLGNLMYQRGGNNQYIDYGLSLFVDQNGQAVSKLIQGTSPCLPPELRQIYALELDLKDQANHITKQIEQYEKDLENLHQEMRDAEYALQSSREELQQKIDLMPEVLNNLLAEGKNESSPEYLARKNKIEASILKQEKYVQKLEERLPSLIAAHQASTAIEDEKIRHSIRETEKLYQPLREKMKALASQDKIYSTATDVYSHGIALATLLELDNRVFEKSAHDVPHYEVKTFEQSAANRHIKDDNTRKKLVDILQHMTHADPRQRPTAQAALQLLNPIISQILSTLPQQEKTQVKVIDLKEIELWDNKTQQDFVKNLAAQFDTVQLAYTGNNLNEAMASQFKKDLENYRIDVKPTIMLANSMDVVLDACKQKSLNNFSIDQYSYLQAIPTNAAMLLSGKKASTNEIPTIPKLVNERDLYPDGNLLSPRVKMEILNKLNAGELSGEGEAYRITKAQLAKAGIHSPLSIVVHKNNGGFDLYAIYQGEKHGKLLGKGGAGSVKLIQNQDTQEFFAFKRQTTKIKSEADYLNQVGQLVTTFSYVPAKPKPGYKVQAGESSIKSFAVITKLAQGTTLSALDTSKLQPPDIAQMFYVAADKLEKIHQKGIIHIDIKPDNIFYDSLNRKATIIDYGTAIRMDSDGTGWRDQAGTRNYLPPEHRAVEGGFKEYSAKTDIASLGYAFAEKVGLIKDDAKAQAYVIADETDPQFVDNTIIKDPKIRQEFLHLVKSMVALPAENRPSLAEIKQVSLNLRNELNKTFKNQVAFLDVNEYAQAKDKSKWIKQLQKADQIVLVNPKNDMHPIDFTLLKNKLATRGVPAGKIINTFLSGDAFNVLKDRYITENIRQPGGPVYQNEYINVNHAALKLADQTKGKSPSALVRNGLFSADNKSKKRPVNEQVFNKENDDRPKSPRRS